MTSRLALAGTLCVAGATAVPATAAELPSPGQRQATATLTRAYTARLAPSFESRKLDIVGARRPLTRVRTVLPVLDEATDDDGNRWLQVSLPGRPNGRTGWIARGGTTAGFTPWHLVVSTSTRRVTAYRYGRAVRSFRVIVGTRSTPTPRGEFFVEEALRLRPSEAGGPYALALSARSDVLQEFAGGPGQIALHGVRNIGGRLGTAVSHGCVRLSTRSITWLVKRVGPGARVTITSSSDRPPPPRSPGRS